MTLAPAPRPRSPAQIEAARRNGARSNGPVTAKGKARASRNALRHGLCSPAILFPGEDPAHFEALRAALEAEYAPASPSARLLVERLAVTVWKLARCDRLEARLATIEPHCPTGRLFPDPGLPRVLSRIPELATLLRWQAQLDRQLHRLTKSLAERDRCASPSGDPAPAEDGPEADGEPDPPATAPPEAFFRPAEAAPARDTEEAGAYDGAAGLANPSNEAEVSPLRVDQDAAVEPALSATEAGCPATARHATPNEPEPEGERIAARAATPGGRATPEGGTDAAEPGVRVPGPDGSAYPRNEPEASPLRVDQGAAVEPASSATEAGRPATARPERPNEPEPEAIGPGGRAAATQAAIAGNALPDLPNEPEPGLSPSRAGIAFNAAQCFGNEAEPEALLARGDLTGYLRARKALERPDSPHPTPPSHPPARGKPGP
jgi:hypothetical protein